MKAFFRCLVLTAICFVALLLRATIMVPLAVEELTQRAELVLRGSVASKACLKDSEGRIYTKIEFKVSEVWKGNLSSNVFIIVHGGGTVGNERAVVDGEAHYEVGEELVAFLRLNQRGEGVSIGLAQGQFRIWKDDVSGEKFACNLFFGQPKATAGQQAAHHAAAGTLARLSLAELRQRVDGGDR